MALSAQAGLNRKPNDGFDGLHSSKDPDPNQMTHSATFNNYKRHVQAQQNSWHLKGSYQGGSLPPQTEPKHHKKLISSEAFQINPLPHTATPEQQ